MEYRFPHLSDRALIDQARGHLDSQRTSTAALLADLAEIEERRIHATAGYPSMYAWCMAELGMTDDAVVDRIIAARTARKYPAIFAMLADGRLHLTAVLLLEKHLTAGNATTLLEASAGRTKSGIAEMLAARFPSTEILPMVLTSQACAHSPVPERVAPSVFVTPNEFREDAAASKNSPAPATIPALMRASEPAAPSKVAPIAAGRHLFQFMGDDAQRDLLVAVQDLIGPDGAGDIGMIFFRALELLKSRLEKRKFATTAKPRTTVGTKSSRGIPAHVRRAVSERDEHRCTFVGTHGRRCPARRGLEFDHIVPIARGGESTVGNVRLLCRTHNQLEAERAFGAEFMENRRAQARSRRDSGHGNLGLLGSG
jgi:hypothetical protein